MDSNVVLEVLSPRDLEVESIKASAEGEVLASSDYRNRQLRARCSTLLAWHFAQNQIATASLDEFIPILSERMSTLDNPESYTFTRLFSYVLKPNLLKGWSFGSVANARPGIKGQDADDEYLRLAMAGDTLITNEGVTPTGYMDVKRSSGRLNLRGRCHQAGARVYSPKEYLDSIEFNIPVQSVMFVEECDRVLRHAWQKGGFTEGDRKMLKRIPAFFGYLFFDEHDPAYSVDEWPKIPWYHGTGGW